MASSSAHPPVADERATGSPAGGDAEGAGEDAEEDGVASGGMASAEAFRAADFSSFMRGV